MLGRTARTSANILKRLKLGPEGMGEWSESSQRCLPETGKNPRQQERNGLLLQRYDVLPMATSETCQNAVQQLQPSLLVIACCALAKVWIFWSIFVVVLVEILIVSIVAPGFESRT